MAFDITKEFQVITTDTHPTPPFRLGEHTIRTIPAIPFGWILDSPDDGTLTWVEVDQFVRRCILPDDLSLYNQALRSSTHIVSKAILAEVYNWLVSEAHDQSPFGAVPPEALSNGHDVTGATSTDDSPATTSTLPI